MPERGDGPPTAESAPVVSLDEVLQIGRTQPDHATGRRTDSVGGIVARLVLAVVVVALPPLLGTSDARTATVAAALLYLPSVAAADAWLGGRAALAVQLVADLGILAVLAELVDRAAVPATVALAIVAMQSQRGGMWWGTLTAAGAGGVMATAGLDSVASASTLTSALVVAVLVGREIRAHDRTAAGLELLRDKAEAILVAIDDAIVTTSATGRIRAVNRAATELIGRSADQALDRECHELLAFTDGSGPVRCEARCGILSDREPLPVALVRVGPTGQRQPVLATAAALRDPDGTIVEVVHSIRDVTAAEQADEAKALFLASTSHELKTPLTVIQGFAQILGKHDVGPSDRALAARMIEERSVQLAGIVDRLLLSSRIEAGHAELAPTMCELSRVLRSRPAELEIATRRPLRVDVPESLPDVWADLGAVTTVLDHLLENAVKYSPDGGEISVGAVVTPTTVTWTVTDNGIGMSDTQAAHCFDRFWQAEGSDVRRFGGTGIGLYIVKSLVEAMGATIDVVTAVGSGTTFSISHPLHPPDEADAVVAEHDDDDTSVIGEIMRQVGVDAAEQAARG